MAHISFYYYQTHRQALARAPSTCSQAPLGSLQPMRLPQAGFLCWSSPAKGDQNLGALAAGQRGAFALTASFNPNGLCLAALQAGRCGPLVHSDHLAPNLP